MRVIAFLALAIFALVPSVHASGVTVFETLKAHCGKAFSGKIVRDTEQSETWSAAHLVLHVRDCSDTELRMPLHLSDNRSRILVLTKLNSGKMRFKHDHRHEDGSSDPVTMYGGDSLELNAPAQTFPVDEESVALFLANGLEASVQNVWHLQVGEGVLRYRLTRPSGRDFMMEFDLSTPVDVPPPAWDRKAGHN